jgi:lipopolysaccharide heptosyltransferase II
VRARTLGPAPEADVRSARTRATFTGLEQPSIETGVAEGLSRGVRRTPASRPTDRLFNADVNRPGEPRRILVGLLCPIGDTLFATPALAALRRRFPRAHITALVYRANAGILDRNPDLDGVIVLNPTGRAPIALALLAKVGTIRRGRYDLLVSLSPAASPLAALAAIPRAVHLRLPGRWWWLAGSRDAQYRGRHAVDHYLLAVAPLLADPVTASQRRPRLYLTADQRAAARARLSAAGVRAGDVVVTLHVGGDGFRGRKRWSPRRFAAVARALAERYAARVVLVGGREDVALAAEVAALLPGGAINLSGQCSLPETAALIERSTLFIGNDSCPLHIAAAVGTPAVGIYGPSSVEQFAPVGGPGYLSRTPHASLPCSPCFHFVGSEIPWLPNPCHSFACLKSISAETVLKAALELLAEPISL